MLLTKEQIQRTVTEYFRDKPVKRVYLFGSYARGDADESSDVDLLVELHESSNVTYFTLGAFLNDMETVLKKQVDLVPESSVYPLVRKRIERDKVLLFEA